MVYDGDKESEGEEDGLSPEDSRKVRKIKLMFLFVCFNAFFFPSWLILLNLKRGAVSYFFPTQSLLLKKKSSFYFVCFRRL